MSHEIRLAKKGETVQQKEIWRNCFGDSTEFIDFYYANRYKEEQTVVLVHDGEISAMLTIMPVNIITPDHQSFRTAMLYAIATDPKKQNKGFATELLNFCDRYYQETTEFSVLVPATKRLFDFYSKRGYRDRFFIREALVSRSMTNNFSFNFAGKGTVRPCSATDYNQRRNKHLKGRLYVAYDDEEIAYQKILSRRSGADIYAIDIDNHHGCAAVERLNADKVLIKEMLIDEELTLAGVALLVQLLDAKECILRTPAFLGEQLGGTIRPFGMVKAHGNIDLEIRPNDLGYIGLAFD